MFAVHSYHLKKASQVFRDMLDLPREGITSEGRSREHPIILNISPHAFESFLWFLYCSAYEWFVCSLLTPTRTLPDGLPC